MNTALMEIRSLQDAAPLTIKNAHTLLETLLRRAMVDPISLDADGIMLCGDPVCIVEIKPAQEQTYLPPEMMLSTVTMIGPLQVYYMVAKLYYFAVTGNVCLDDTITSFEFEPDMQEALRRMTDINPDTRLLGVQAARQVLGNSAASNPFQNVDKQGGIPVPTPAHNMVSIPYPPASNPLAPENVPPVRKPANAGGRLYWLCLQQGDDLVPLMELNYGFNGSIHTVLNPGCDLMTLMVVTTDLNQNEPHVLQTIMMKIPRPFPGGKAYIRTSRGKVDVVVHDLGSRNIVAQEAYDLSQEVPSQHDHVVNA